MLMEGNVLIIKHTSFVVNIDLYGMEPEGACSFSNHPHWTLLKRSKVIPFSGPSDSLSRMEKYPSTSG